MRHIIKRGRWFHFKRRIPNLYSHFYDNDVIQISLKTDSETVAIQRASILNNELEKIWSQLTEHDQAAKENLFEQAVTLARMSGFGYRPAAEIADQSMGKILSRINSIKGDGNINPEKVHAILGIHDRPELLISKILESYFEFEKPNLLNKSDDQIRKWKNPRKKAISNFIAVCGDKDVSLITRDDVLTFRGWWYERIKYEELTANSSNKDFSYLAQILNYARDDKQIDLDVGSLLARVRFTETASTRPPFTTDYHRFYSK